MIVNHAFPFYIPCCILGLMVIFGLMVRSYGNINSVIIFFHLVVQFRSNDPVSKKQENIICFNASNCFASHNSPKFAFESRTRVQFNGLFVPLCFLFRAIVWLLDYCVVIHQWLNPTCKQVYLGQANYVINFKEITLK